MHVSAQITPTSEQGKKLQLTEAIGFSADYEFGESLEDSINLFGKEAVHNSFLDKAVVAFQAKLRSIAVRVFLSQITADQGTTEAGAWKLGVITRPSGGNIVEKAKALTSKMSKEAKQKLLEQLMAEMGE